MCGHLASARVCVPDRRSRGDTASGYGIVKRLAKTPYRPTAQLQSWRSGATLPLWCAQLSHVAFSPGSDVMNMIRTPFLSLVAVTFVAVVSAAGGCGSQSSGLGGAASGIGSEVGDATAGSSSGFSNGDDSGSQTLGNNVDSGPASDRVRHRRRARLLRPHRLHDHADRHGPRSRGEEPHLQRGRLHPGQHHGRAAHHQAGDQRLQHVRRADRQLHRRGADRLQGQLHAEGGPRHHARPARRPDRQVAPRRCSCPRSRLASAPRCPRPTAACPRRSPKVTCRRWPS